jgi:FemAB-related protein (PEP-CTERM system-associated)
LRCLSAPPVELRPSNLYATFISDLPAKPEDVLTRMPKKSRAEARKARDKHGLTLTEGLWYFEDFYRLFHRNKRSLGSPGLPHAFFWTLRKEFGEGVRIHAVHKGNEVVAAVMSFVWRGELMAYYSGAADGADRNLSASNFMYMALQEWAVREGQTRFDFGRSRRDSGAFTFKEHQGFTPQPLPYRFHFVRDRALPSLTPSNPRTKILRDSWARLPRPIARRLSEELCRYLP